MITLKKALAATLAITMLFSLSACGDKASNSTPTSAPAESAQPADNAEQSDSDSTAPLNVVFIPKLVGIPWFNQMEQGFKDYADEFGTMTIKVSGPPDADPVQQASFVEDAIATKPDVIVVVPNDTAVLEPSLQKAREAGIVVITQEASSVINADADIEFLIMELTGKQYMEALASNMGGEGGYAIMVGGLTVENHNARADAAVAYQEEKYPDMYQVISRVEGSEDIEEAHDKTLELILAHPDLKGIMYIGSNGALGGAAAIRERNLVGQFAITGTSLPSQSKPFLQDGSISANLIGSPRDIAYASAYIVEQLVANDMDVSSITEVPIYGEVQVDGKIILFHSDSEVTFENADSFGF